jgi:hypothetical protein
MKWPGRLFSMCMLAAVVALPACQTGDSQTAGIDRGGFQGGAVGSVSGFGSVIVNGVHYETDSAAISVNGVPAVEADLQVGYVVVIQADILADGEGAQATTIDFSHDVIGPLMAVDLVQSRVTVLGQVVKVNDSTAYGPGIEPASVDGLALLSAGQALRVSGFVGSDDEILATRVELGTAGADLEVVGVVAGLEVETHTFDIGGLVVNYSNATVEGFSGGVPLSGNRVEVSGSLLGMEGELIATKIKRKESESSFEEDDQLEVEGLVTALTSSSSFRVSGIPVLTNPATEYFGGDASMLGLNVRVEVEGLLDSSGVLVAYEVEFRPDGESRIEALAGPVNVAAGTLEILGIHVEVSAVTSFEDKSPAELRPFSLSDINSGDPLRVIGTESIAAPGTVVATRIERREKVDELKLKGTATNVSDPTFSILGVTVTTNSQTDIEDDFFAIADGRLVEAEVDDTSGSVVATKVEIKN